MMKRYLFLFPAFFYFSVSAQVSDTLQQKSDSASFLKNVTVSAYANTIVKLKNVPAAVAVLNKADLQRFDENSLSSLNTVPGVDLQERSPGSIRLTMRGSALRSPFGVRDVKIYWDDFPFTDASGNSYLNLIDPDFLHSIELIKGPPGSLYGEGTQGAVILHSPVRNDNNKINDFSAALSGGTYGKFVEETGWNTQHEDFFSSLQQSHYQSNGYRAQTELRKDVVKWNTVWNINSKETFSALAFYTDLYYKTPGGITLKQLSQDPSQARSSNVLNDAYVRNKTPFVGLSLKSQISTNFINTTSVVLDHTAFTNPTVSNFEQRSEWNESARTVFSFSKSKPHFGYEILAGGEIQNNNSNIDDYGNSAGTPDTVQSLNKAAILQYFGFAQLNLNFGKRWITQTGMSLNKIDYKYDDIVDNVPPINKNIGFISAPRFSVLYELNNNLSLFATVDKGFSAPTLAEILPSTGIFYVNLQPEYGWNYETGIKGSVLKNRLDISASVYYFKLVNAIVRRSDINGSDYFVNSGSSIEKGVEVWGKAYVIRKKTKYFTSLDVFNSLAYQPYRFNQYIYDSSNYSGNEVTGVPRFVNVTGIDMYFQKNYFSTLTLNCTSAIPLNDSNSIFAKPYQLLQIKVGKVFYFKKFTPQIYIAVDNVLDETYSLGDDINSAGGRYFNPAPKINFTIGGKVNF